MVVRVLRSFSLLLWLLLVVTATADSIPNTETDDDTAAVSSIDSNSVCTLYLAESGIPNAGFGVYTTKSFKKGDVIQKADSPAIVITDIGRHQADGEEPEWQHDNYLWSAYSQEAFEALSSSASVVMLGVLANFHTALKSAAPTEEQVYNDTILDRFKDPGAGAFSYHMGHDFIASYRDIEANEEIFVDYGEEWFEARSESGFDGVPLAKDFEDGEATIDMMRRLLRREPQKECVAAGDSDTKMTCTSEQEKNKANNERCFVEDRDAIKIIHDIVKLYNNRTASLLPSTPSELDSLPQGVENGLAFSKLPRRSADWIISNGRCLDNIVSKRSTIFQAGMGGFARRTLPKGSQIVPAPVLLISDRDILTMYDYYEDIDAQPLRDESKVVGKQLLLNYCLGHDDSHLLFCSLSNDILVNHCSARRSWDGECGSRGPNAAYRWATDWDRSTAKSLKLSLDEISQKQSRGLTLELYATRDIQSGEEIFVDYGIAWEEAWTSHEKSWNAPTSWFSKNKSYQNTIELNRMKNETLRTLSEEKRNPYPGNALTACIYWESDEDDDWTEEIDKDDVDNWKAYDNEDILETFGRPGDVFSGSKEGEVFAEYWPCKIMLKNDDNATAVVRIFQSPSHERTAWDDEEIPRLLTNYSLNSVKFFHRPYKSDQHLPGAFRHHIGLPDYLLPDQWRTSMNTEAD